MIQGDPQYAFLLTGTNDEIGISLVPSEERSFVKMDTEDVEEWRRRLTSQESGFERVGSRIPEEHGFCDTLQKCGGSGSDQTLEERVSGGWEASSQVPRFGKRIKKKKDVAT